MGLPEPPPLGASALPSGTYDGQTVLVTGGGTGIGKAIATEFARLGANIAILSRKPDHLDAGVAAIEAVGAPVVAVGCDIRDPDSIVAAYESIFRILHPRPETALGAVAIAALVGFIGNEAVAHPGRTEDQAGPIRKAHSLLPSGSRK